MKGPWEPLRRSLHLKSLWWVWISTLTAPQSPTPPIASRTKRTQVRGPPLHHNCALDILLSSWECNQILLAFWLHGEMNSALKGLPFSWDVAGGRGMSEKSQELPGPHQWQIDQKTKLGKASRLQGGGSLRLSGKASLCSILTWAKSQLPRLSVH